MRTNKWYSNHKAKPPLENITSIFRNMHGLKSESGQGGLVKFEYKNGTVIIVINLS